MKFHQKTNSTNLFQNSSNIFIISANVPPRFPNFFKIYRFQNFSNFSKTRPIPVLWLSIIILMYFFFQLLLKVSIKLFNNLSTSFWKLYIDVFFTVFTTVFQDKFKISPKFYQKSLQIWGIYSEISRIFSELRLNNHHPSFFQNLHWLHNFWQFF